MKQPKTEKISIRTWVIGITSIAFILVFAVLYLLFSVSLGNMLAEWEVGNMQNAARLAEGTLRTSVNDIPRAARDWSARSSVYEALGRGDTEKLAGLVGTEPFRLNRVNFVAFVAKDGEVLYEGFYNLETQALEPGGINLDEFYAQLHEEVTRTWDYLERIEVTQTQGLGLSGFMEYGGQAYYVSAFPVLAGGNKGPCAGAVYFGRAIDDQEIEYLTDHTEGSFPFLLRPLSMLGLNEPDTLSLATGSNEVLVKTTDDTATAYVAIQDIHGDNTITLVYETHRTFFLRGEGLKNTLMATMALSCAMVLWLIIIILTRVVVKPIGDLVSTLESMDPEDVTGDISPSGAGKEIWMLTGAVNNMLERINSSRDMIEKSNKRLYYQANYDTLTGLRNRASTVEEIDGALGSSAETPRFLTLFYVDLNRFKFVNDTLGHASGDKFIIAVGRRMRDEFGYEVMISRLGGDEFLLVQENLVNRMEQQLFAERILHLFAVPFNERNRELDISATVGSSSYPQDGKDAETLIKNAELAMYHAKNKGDGFYAPYRHEMDVDAQRKIDLENRLRDAINQNCCEFMLYFQPKLHVQSGRIESCEALVRWDTQEGVVNPAEFIPLAEDTGLILPLSWWIVRECYRRNKQFEAEGIECTMAMNVSAQVLLHNNFLAILKEEAHATGVSPKKLDVEIIESTLVEDLKRVNMVLKTLHSMGMEVSVDDFGTGYSSLSYLNKLEVDRIKIDRSFVIKIESSAEDQAIIKAIVAMAKSLNMIVTAEGVETVEQYRFLRDVGCDEIQGYLISRPQPTDEFMQFVKEWNEGKRHVVLD